MRARAAPEEDPMTIKAPDKIAPFFVRLASAEAVPQESVVRRRRVVAGKVNL